MAEEKKNKKPFYKRIWFWVVAVIVIIIIATNLGGNNTTNTTQSNSGNSSKNATTQINSKKYSMDKFNQIQMGMTYDQVKAILGDGTEDSSSGSGDQKTVSYSWKNSDGSNISITLQGNKVITKAQAFLQSMNAKVTMEKYNKIKDGMSYDQVKAILGEGQLTSESQILDQKTEIYSWINSDGSNMNVTFQNGTVNTKAQFELK